MQEGIFNLVKSCISPPDITAPLGSDFCDPMCSKKKKKFLLEKWSSGWLLLLCAVEEDGSPQVEPRTLLSEEGAAPDCQGPMNLTSYNFLIQ